MGLKNKHTLTDKRSGRFQYHASRDAQLSSGLKGLKRSMVFLEIIFLVITRLLWQY